MWPFYKNVLNMHKYCSAAKKKYRQHATVSNIIPQIMSRKRYVVGREQRRAAREQAAGSHLIAGDGKGHMTKTILIIFPMTILLHL